MEKRFFLAFFITLVFFVVYSHFMSKYFPQQPVSQKVGQDIREKQEQIPLPKDEILGGSFDDEAAADILPQEKIGNFIVTFSPLGGYIKEISIQDKENRLPFRNIGFLLQDKNKIFSPLIRGNRLIFQGPNNEKKEFIFEGYNLQIKFASPPTSPMIVFSNDLTSKGWNMEERYQEVFYFYEDGLKRSAPRKTKEKSYEGVKFAGGRGRYYCVSLVEGSYDVEWVKEKGKGYLYLTTVPSVVSLYIGPQTEKSMKPFGLQGVIYYGFFHIIGTGMIKLLYFLHSLTKNWGLSIILFSSLIYLVLFPFTAKSTKAMKRMQEFQPEIEALKEKYKDNPQKMQKETLALYREHKINPLGGCLPLLFQFPVFIALYQVLFRLVDLKNATFLWIKDLASPDRFLQLPFTLPLLGTNYLNILPLCIAILGIVQQRVIASPSSSAQASQQKTMGLVMSVFIGFIFYKFPSALVLYWFTQNILTIAYQIRIRKVPSPSPTG